MNTGVGRSGYSIIGQGKIAEIVSQKSDERRTIFEDAAGISKYRFRKNEAERHLQGAVDNMVRAEDILRELEARVAPLQRDAEKSKRGISSCSRKRNALTFRCGCTMLRMCGARSAVSATRPLPQSVCSMRRTASLRRLRQGTSGCSTRLSRQSRELRRRRKKLRDNSAASLELEGSVKGAA